MSALLRVFTSAMVASLGLTMAAHGGAVDFGFPLAPSGCAMAHCDQRLSDQTGTAGPSSPNWVRIDSTTSGSLGLGCVSNTKIAACTYAPGAAGQSNLIVFDAGGNRIWEDRGLLGSTAWKSAAILGTDGTLIAADQDSVLRADPASNAVLWRSRKRDRGEPVSPVLVGANRSMVLVATWSGWSGPPRDGTAEVSIWDAASGALLSRKAITDPVSGKLYVTRNTPAVSGNRAYVLAAAHGDQTDARLYALDVCGSAQCGGRGTINIAWHFDFSGGSGSSPLLIGSRLFFDGRIGQNGGTFMAVDDLGSAPALVWKKSFSGRFYASAVQDPRGGLWVATAPAQNLLRLNEGLGTVEQSINVGQVFGLGSDYAVGSVITLSPSRTGAVTLTFGAFVPSQETLPSYLGAIDVSSTPNGAALWTYQVAPSFSANAAAGQFPVLIDAAGARRLVFPGKTSSTFFVGE